MSLVPRAISSSLRRKIFVTVILVSSIPALLLFLFSYLSQRRLLLEAHEDFLEDLLRKESVDLNDRVREVVELLRLHGNQEDFQRSVTRGNSNSSTGSVPHWSRIMTRGFILGYATPQGELSWISDERYREPLLQYLKLPRPSEVIQEWNGYLPRGLGPRGEHGQAVVATPVFDRVALPEDSRTAGFAHPALQGWGIVIVPPDELLRNVPAGRFLEVGIMNTIEGLVTDSSGSLLREYLVRRPFLVGTTIRGRSIVPPNVIPGQSQPLFFVYSRVNVLNSGRREPGLPEWYVVALAGSEEVSSDMILAFWRAMLVGLFLLLIVFIMGIALSRPIVEPLRLLRDEVRALAEGDLDARADVPTRDELSELARDINTMAARLRESYRSLQESVTQAESRAAQLLVINQITSSMTAALTIAETFQSFARHLAKLGPIDYASLALLSNGAAAEKLRFSADSEEFEDPFSEAEVRQAYRREGPTLVDSDHLRTRSGGRLNRGIILPLVASREIIGTLNLASKNTEAFTPEALGDLTFVAEALAAAIQHNRLYEQVSQFAASLEEKVRERTRALEEAQVKLLQTEKFAATGKLAANLAHEINNPLGIIKNHLTLLDTQFHRVSGESTNAKIVREAKHTMQVCREEIDRIARLTRSLLNFYRTSSEEPREIDLVVELEQIILLFRKGFDSRRIEVAIDAPPDLPHTHLSPDLVRQVFMNLLRNAEDAIDRGGRIAIKLERASDYRPTTRGSDSNVHGGIRVIVSDTGKGIEPENLGKIFDPFFTTKSAESGTGLGLSVTLGIMERLEGMISVKSELGSGTTFELIFPVIGRPVAAGSDS